MTIRTLAAALAFAPLAVLGGTAIRIDDPAAIEALARSNRDVSFRLDDTLYQGHIAIVPRERLVPLVDRPAAKR